MKLLLDEHLSPRIAESLRTNGHDVLSVAESQGLVGADDATVMARAVAEKRAVVTNNVRDFRPLGAELINRGRNHFGVILLHSGYRRSRADISRIVAALDAILIAHKSEDGLLNREIWL